MTPFEFINICIEAGIPRNMAVLYTHKTMKETYTEYDVKAVREAADYEGRLRHGSF